MPTAAFKSAEVVTTAAPRTPAVRRVLISSILTYFVQGHTTIQLASNPNLLPQAELRKGPLRPTQVDTSQTRRRGQRHPQDPKPDAVLHSWARRRSQRSDRLPALAVQARKRSHGVLCGSFMMAYRRSLKVCRWARSSSGGDCKGRACRGTWITSTNPQVKLLKRNVANRRGRATPEGVRVAAPHFPADAPAEPARHRGQRHVPTDGGSDQRNCSRADRRLTLHVRSDLRALRRRVRPDRLRLAAMAADRRAGPAPIRGER